MLHKFRIDRTLDYKHSTKLRAIYKLFVAVQMARMNLCRDLRDARYGNSKLSLMTILGKFELICFSGQLC